MTPSETSQTLQTSPAPAAGFSSIADKKNLFILHHRRKNNPHPIQKYFFHGGDLKSAIERGKRHCDEIGEVFIMVRPFLSDLDFDEKKHRGEY